MLLHRAYSIHDALRPNRACYQTSASPKSRYGSQKLDASSAGYRQLQLGAKMQTAKPRTQEGVVLHHDTPGLQVLLLLLPLLVISGGLLLGGVS
jgi:hypothetical protein